VGGASKGLGFAVARALASEGAKVSICAREKGPLEEARERIGKERGAEVRAVPCDVREPAMLDAWIDDALEAWGGVDIYFHNAGGPPPGTFESLPEEAWDEAYGLLLRPVIHAVKRVLPGMKDRRWGRILNLASITVKQPSPDLVLSNALRSALVSMAKTLAGEVGPFGITVNNLCPGYFDTERARSLLAKRAAGAGEEEDAIRRALLREVPLRRMGDPDELAALAAFLCSEKASYITGTTILVDGGLYKGLM